MISHLRSIYVNWIVTIKMKEMHCPECGTKIEVRDKTRYPRFVCPSCRSELCVPPGSQLRTSLLGAAIAFFGCYLIGFRGITLVALGILFSLVCGSILTVVGLVVMPPTLERYYKPGSLDLKL